MNTRQAAIISAYTGYMLGSFSDMHEYIESIMGRPVFTHEMGNSQVAAEIKELAKADFVALSEEIEGE